MAERIDRFQTVEGGKRVVGNFLNHGKIGGRFQFLSLIKIGSHHNAEEGLKK